jgi:glycosyltransferase involved in cell wall biosynthesis
LMACGNLIDKDHPSIVISTSPPVATHLVALSLKRRYGLRWVADLRDPIYGNPFRRRRWGTGYDRLIEGAIMRNADAVIANTDVSAQELTRRYARYRSKVHLIWNGYDPADKMDFQPAPERRRKILLHAGSVYGGRHPGVILASLERLFNKGLVSKESLQVDLLGTMDMGSPWIQQSRLPDFVREGWVTYSSGTVPQPEARRRIAEADYLLLLDINESGASLQVPAKLFEYIRAGRPILAVTTRNSPAERILRASGVSSNIIYQNDPADLTDGKIARFISSHATTATPSAWFHRTFDTRVQTEYMASLLDQLIRA